MVKWVDCFNSGSVQHSSTHSYTPLAHCQHAHAHCKVNTLIQLLMFLRERKRKAPVLICFICAPRSAKVCSSVDRDYCHSSLQYGIISYTLIYFMNQIYGTFFCLKGQRVTSGVSKCLCITKSSNLIQKGSSFIKLS